MISYKLAKQLKDAGYPQKVEEIDSRFYSWDKSCWYFVIKHKDAKPVSKDDIKIPTLSELIEACGDEIDFALFRWGNWVCGDRSEYEQDWITRAEGETPEEAVAKLWLKLYGTKI